MNRRFVLGKKSLQLDAARLLPLLKKGGLGGGVTSGPAVWVYKDWPGSPPDLFPQNMTFEGEYEDTDGMWPHPYYGSDYSIGIVQDGVYGIFVDTIWDWTGSALSSSERVYPYLRVWAKDAVLDQFALGLGYAYGMPFDQYNSDAGTFMTIYTTKIVALHAHDESYISISLDAEDYGSPSYDMEYQSEVQVMWLAPYPS